MLQMLDQILEFKPDSWTHADYSGKRYALIEVEPSSDEYNEITAPFKSYTVENVERIQNPYALGYFMLRKEQLSSRGQGVSEVRTQFACVRARARSAAAKRLVAHKT